MGALPDKRVIYCLQGGVPPKLVQSLLYIYPEVPYLAWQEESFRCLAQSGTVLQDRCLTWPAT